MEDRSMRVRYPFLPWLLPAAALWMSHDLGGSEPPPRDAGTERMARRLEEIIKAADPMKNLFMNRERAQVYATRLAAATTPLHTLTLQAQWALELLNSGQTDQAIQVLAAVADGYREHDAKVPPANWTLLRTLRAISHLRQAEQDNCLANHTSESCLFPIRAGGVHQNPRGSRAAIVHLAEQLKAVPSDLRARWLMNLAYMTLGDYPEQVPAEWRLDPTLFEPSAPFPRFPEIAGRLGLDIDDLAGGSIAEDFDGDGYLDIMASSMALRGQLRFFRNNADGTFSERTEAAGLLGEVGGLNLVHADYDNDGFPDVLVLRGGWMGEGGRFPNSLLRNNRDGTFSDVTEAAGLLSFHPTQTAVWFDYNGDGWIDLFVGNETEDEHHPHPCELFRNNGDGTFTECAAALNLAVAGYVKAVVSDDYNNDGHPDLYLSLRDRPNLLFRNDGPAGSDAGGWRFTEVGQAAGVTAPVFSFPAWFFDYDNDGWSDLFVSGYNLLSVGDVAADYLGLPYESARARFYRNNGDGTFSDLTRSAGLDHLFHTMGCNYGDLDSDGYLDFYLGTGDPNLGTLIPNRMLKNVHGREFVDVTVAGGVGHLQKGHGVSFADFDHDGDQDLYCVTGGAYSGDRYRNVFFENPGHGHHWLVLKLEGRRSNRAAIGARIKVTVESAQGVQVIRRTVSSGSSFGGNPLRQEVGLGPASRLRSVEIFWPATGKTQEVAGCAMDRFYRIQEGEPAASEWKLGRFQLRSEGKTGSAHAHH